MKLPAGEPADHGEPDARTLDEVFGEVLPKTTSDERDPGERSTSSDREFSDDWYLDNRPPHHDR